MKQVCALIGKFFGVIAIIFLIIGLTMPTSFSWVFRPCRRHFRLVGSLGHYHVWYGHDHECQRFRPRFEAA